MEERKQQEIEYYNGRAEKMRKDELSAAGKSVDFEGFEPFFLNSYKFCYKWLKDNCPNKRVLDYGCGMGIHLLNLAKIGKEVIGIDLSQKSLEIAEKRLRNENLEGRAKALTMDCENLEFPDGSFDVVFDGGTFSSLDLDKALSEISRVLKPSGILIGIETLGHNPFTNLKRKINKITGKRTSWAAGHILKTRDLEEAKRYFNKVEVYYFHLISWLAFPFLRFPGGKIFLRLLEFIDRIVLRPPFLRKYAFKIVFVFSGPIKQYDVKKIV